METAAQNSKELHQDGGLKASNASCDISQVARSEYKHREQKKKSCYRCGRSHDEKDCKFREATCHVCGKKGHIAPVCRSKKPRQVPPPRNGKKQDKQDKSLGVNKWVGISSGEHETDSTEDDSMAMFTVSGSPTPPIMIPVIVNGKTLQMELDTGATVSIMSQKHFASLFPNIPIPHSKVTLQTYTGEPMKVLGEVSVRVTYQQQPTQDLPLVIVEGHGSALLGRNWLHHIRLDWAGIKAVFPVQRTLEGLLEKYSNVFTDELGTIMPYKAKLIVAPSPVPKFHRPRSVPFALKTTVEEELDRLESQGVLEKVNVSDWAAPIVVVPKKDGRVRICGDYKVTINPMLDVNQYPLPRPQDLFATLARGKHFTKLDISHAYNQLILDEESRQYLTINTHRGLYRYNCLPFGVASAPAMFQKTMDTVLRGLKGVICYIDDILITGATEAEHLERLEQVLQRLQEHGIRVKQEKCYFMQPSVQYLGHRIDAEGLHATDDKLDAITQAPTPKNVTELRSFLGLINYYGHFIQNLSSLLHPLNKLLCKDTPWKWSQECTDTFSQAKEKIVSPNVLVHYDPSLPIRLAGDASAYGIGAVISHVMKDGKERPIAFASRTLLPSEQNYAQLEKEALSLIFGVSKFHTYLYGRHFTLVTDHKPLTVILGPKKGIPPMAAARLQRWAVCLSAYSYDIKFKPTAQHCNADGLSRLPLHSVCSETSLSEPSVFNIHQLDSLPVTAVQLAAATRTDPVLSQVYSYTLKGWPAKVGDEFKPFSTRKGELSVQNGCLLWGTRVVIPFKQQQRILDDLHRDHPGITKMKAVSRSYFWWPGLDSNIEMLVKSCQECQAVKNAPPVAPLHPWVWPTKPWQRVHVDFAGPFQGSMFFVAVDAHSKWPEVHLMSSTTTAKTLDVLRKIFSAHGLPDQIVSDNGPQFVSSEFAYFMKQNGVKHTRSSPYHPSTNGLAERFVQTMKQSLKASAKSDRSLSQRLYDFLLTYRTSPHTTTGVSPSALFLNRELRTRFDLLKPSQEGRVMEKQSQQKTDHDNHAKERTFFLGQSVMAKNLRPGPAWIPAVVVERLGPLSYLVETEDRDLWQRHVDHLKELATPEYCPSSGSASGGSVPAVGAPAALESSTENDPLHPQDDDPQELEMPVALRGTSSEATNADTTAEVPNLPESPIPTTASTPVRNPYPRRDHRPPNYLRPTF